MGRAAAVRATTKAKTDAAKAKNNGRYAKKIIMAVKAGGNRMSPVIAMIKNLFYYLFKDLILSRTVNSHKS